MKYVINITMHCMHINVHRCHMRVARDGKITVPTSQLGNFVNKIKLSLSVIDFTSGSTASCDMSFDLILLL